MTGWNHLCPDRRDTEPGRQVGGRSPKQDIRKVLQVVGAEAAAEFPARDRLEKLASSSRKHHRVEYRRRHHRRSCDDVGGKDASGMKLGCSGWI
jgi:hypothetical protein